MIAVLTMIAVLAITTQASEPECSPFHFVEQTLTKVIKVEMVVQKMKEDLETTQQKVLEKLQELETDKRQFKTDLDNELENVKREYNEMNEKHTEQMQNFVAEFEKIKDRGGRQTVSFLAKEVTDISPNAGQKLVFKTTLVNEGNGYDNTTGIFTAPGAGVYLFTIQLCVPSSDFYYNIVAENNNIKQGLFYDRQDISCHTADAITTLRSGGSVWITPHHGGRKLQQGSNYWNTFSGVLIHSHV